MLIVLISQFPALTDWAVGCALFHVERLLHRVFVANPRSWTAFLMTA